MAVYVLLDCGVELFGDPLPVLDHDGLDAVKSHPRHEGVRALQPFRVLAVVLDEPGGQLLGDLRVVHRGEAVASTNMRARRAADVDLPAAALNGDDPDILDVGLRAVARTTRDRKLDLRRGLHSLQPSFELDAHPGGITESEAAELLAN